MLFVTACMIHIGSECQVCGWNEKEKVDKYLNFHRYVNFTTHLVHISKSPK